MYNLGHARAFCLPTHEHVNQKPAAGEREADTAATCTEGGAAVLGAEAAGIKLPTMHPGRENVHLQSTGARVCTYAPRKYARGVTFQTKL